MDEDDDGPFAVRHGKHAQWDIEATPTRIGQKWRANSHATRQPAEDGNDQGDSLTFSDLGDFDTAEQAIERAISWTINWIEANN